MRISFVIYNHYKRMCNHYKRKSSWFFMVTPSIGIGYTEKFLHITLYFLVWEFSLEFGWNR